MKLSEVVQEYVGTNGAVLTLLQVSLVALAARGLASAGLAHGQRLPTITGLGISAKALTVRRRAIRTRKSPAGLTSQPWIVSIAEASNGNTNQVVALRNAFTPAGGEAKRA